jgi:diaminohydroxyphosphoribosylaminopyrimidine deaminase/5-amino-6-(5-phosphoribosylamino)uracil reductase
VHQLRHQLDAIMVGAGTVLADDPRLTARLDQGEGADPIRIILDTKLRLPADRQIFNSSSPAPTWLVCGPDVEAAALESMKARGIKVLPTPLKNGRIDLDGFMGTLGGMNVTSLLIEGGGRVAGSALADDIVDKFIFFYAPKILGGDEGVPMFSGTGPDLMRDALGLDHVTVSREGDDIMVEGYRHSPETSD